jgi:hypothetical protein
MRVDASAVLPRDAGRTVTRAVVDKEHIDRETARLGRERGEDIPNRSLLIARNDNSKAPRRSLRHPRAGPRRRPFHRKCPA